MSFLVEVRFLHVFVHACRLFWRFIAAIDCSSKVTEINAGKYRYLHKKAHEFA